MRTQYQVENETKIRRNQKLIKDNNNELIVKINPKKKQPIQQQPKFKPPNFPSCKQFVWLEFKKGWYWQNCEYIIDEQNHQIDKQVRRQDHDFSTRLPYANKKIREIYISRANTNTTEDMIDKLQSLKGKIKFRFYKNISNYYDEMNDKNFRLDEDPFAENAQGIARIYHEVLF